MLSFEEALQTVREKLAAANFSIGAETVALAEACGRTLAEDVLADRDYPPFDRSTRDGFAVRAQDVGAVPVELRLRGEIAAGMHFDGEIASGECIAIMTGAPLPAGTDAVVMVEHTESRDDVVKILRGVCAGENVVPKGSEVRQGSRVLGRGRRLGAADLALLASMGKPQPAVYARPPVAILPTGDEVVPVEHTPEWFQVRNANAVSLAAQVTSAGGVPRRLPIAPDEPAALRQLIREGLKSPLLLVTGGVSAGKYDLVEQVLAELGAESYFQSVALRPGKPLVFGRAGDSFFFGLPGNPVSTFVTFELFVRPAIAVMGGTDFAAPMFLRAQLAEPIEQRTGLTVFVPASLGRAGGDLRVNRISWQGSGDLAGLAAANCFVVLYPHQTALTAGDWVDVMVKGQ